jgi:hypothetical protein
MLLAEKSGVHTDCKDQDSRMPPVGMLQGSQFPPLNCAHSQLRKLRLVAVGRYFVFYILRDAYLKVHVL